MKRSEAEAYRRRIESAASGLDDESALDSMELFPLWRVDINVQVGERYRYMDKLYRVVQAHKTQGDWTPDIVPALFAEVSIEAWPEWKQPAGAHDAYAKGDHVAHNGKHWESGINANVWEPGVYGWSEI